MSFGIKLYKFAQEMQIDALTEELVGFLDEQTNWKPSEIFALFEHYQMTGDQLRLDNCKLVRTIK